MIETLSTPRLSELFASRQFVRHAYISISTRRDAKPYDARLISVSHLLFTAISTLDAVLDDELVSIHGARGAVQRSNEIIKEIGEIMRKGGVEA